MKTPLLSAGVLTLALAAWSMPPAHADVLQKDTPGAQGTEGTNPTHQDSNVTGPNGEHANNTNPANSPTKTSDSCSGSCPNR